MNATNNAIDPFAPGAVYRLPQSPTATPAPSMTTRTACTALKFTTTEGNTTMTTRHHGGDYLRMPIDIAVDGGEYR